MERRISPNVERAMPPGQRFISTFPVYDIVETRPTVDLTDYRFSVGGAVERDLVLSWDELIALPKVELVADFHCVTRWSKSALTWIGIPFEVILEQVRPSSSTVQVMAHSLDGYTTNVPMPYLETGDVILAVALNGRPLTPEHGAPLRLVVPQLYAWKSAKYLCHLEFQPEIKPGFWEERGYHLIGDPWFEQRFAEPIAVVRENWRRIRVQKLEKEEAGGVGE